MKMYFCPRCGQDYDASQCMEDGSLLRCPQCNKPRVLMRGSSCIALGLVLAIAATAIPHPYVRVMGNVLAGGIILTGAARSVRQRWARRAFDDDSTGCDID